MAEAGFRDVVADDGHYNEYVPGANALSSLILDAKA